MISGIQLKNAIISGANNILKNKNLVNELNIFPVPDGDTGTNMSMTISSAVSALGEISENANVGETVKAFVPALLRGARGNSGVILSLQTDKRRAVDQNGRKKARNEKETGSRIIGACYDGYSGHYRSCGDRPL